jgi:hypothetical protein
MYEIGIFLCCFNFLGGYAMGAGLGRRLGDPPKWLHEREGVLAVPPF